MRNYDKFYIDGKWVPSLDARPSVLVNPATEEAFATVSLGSSADVDRAVAAARAAFPAYSQTRSEERIALIERVVEALALRETDLAAALVEEIGCPRSATVQVTGALDHFRQAVKTLQSYRFQTVLGRSIVQREPIGVCGLVTPWNWPVQTPCTKIAAVLAAGCTCVIKPSEFSPSSMLIVAEALHEAGVPAGVFNLVNGDGSTVGTAISAHPDVDMVSFTGSTRAGIMVAQAAAPTVKRVSQELGGKSANIVLPDADLRRAAQWNATRVFFNSGQSCHAPCRMLVRRDQVEEVVRYLVEAVGTIRIGDPNDPATTMGPVVNGIQFERIQHYIGLGLAEGARLVTGGLGRPEGVDRGYFVKPTIFADVSPDMTIAREEVFGPVLAVMPYGTEEEAIEIANGTDFGLGGYLFTASTEKAVEVGLRMRAGRIFLNGAPGDPAAPMGGYKKSGNGREMGVFGMEEYLEVKAMFGYSERAAS